MVSMILAISENFVIGKDGDLPWPFLPKDMGRFQRVTKEAGNVLMGRKTWDSLPEKFRPLPDRENFVASRDPDFSPNGAIVVRDVEKTLAAYRDSPEELAVTGGAELYKIAHPFARYMYVTVIHERFDGDVRYNPCTVGWEILEQKFHRMDERHKCAFTFLTLERIRDRNGKRIQWEQP